MSSDSDVEYESADEDANAAYTAECHSSLIENSEVEVTDAVKFEDQYKEETKSLENSKNFDCSQGSSPNFEQVASKSLSSTECPAIDEPSKANNSKKEEIKTGKVEESVENSFLETDSCKSDVADAPKSTEKEAQTPLPGKDSKYSEETVETKSRPEKQRVPLRLEKKIQQKSLSSDDASTVKSQAEEGPKVSEVKSSSSWGFGGWGSSLLSTAAYSVSTLTNQVSQGIGTVLETVESTLGAPSPEELAASMSKTSQIIDPTDEKDSSEVKEQVSEPKSSILPDVSSWTKVFEDTGSKVLMGGLDTLELIGKKTIDMITEGDPGLRKKRSLFADGVTLSQILREAKTEADESTQNAGSEGTSTVHFSQFFDEYQGLVHLEALEMLSKQCEAKVHRNFMRLHKDADMRKQLEEIKSICEDLPSLDDSSDSSEDFEEFGAICKKSILELNLPFNVENLIKTQKKISDVIKNYETTNRTSVSPEEIYESAINNLAEFTAKSIETFHKLAELMLVQTKWESDAEHLATNLTGLTNVMCIEVNSLSSRYQHCLDSLVQDQTKDSSNPKTNVTTIVTNLYVEASNSIKYIQDAFLLLVPVLQASTLELS